MKMARLVVAIGAATALSSCGGPPDEIAHGTPLDADAQKGFVMATIFGCASDTTGQLGKFSMPKRSEICSCALPRAASKLTQQAMASAQNGKTDALEYVLDKALDGCIAEKKRQWHS